MQFAFSVESFQPTLVLMSPSPSPKELMMMRMRQQINANAVQFSAPLLGLMMNGDGETVYS